MKKELVSTLNKIIAGNSTWLSICAGLRQYKNCIKMSYFSHNKNVLELEVSQKEKKNKSDQFCSDKTILPDSDLVSH